MKKRSLLLISLLTIIALSLILTACASDEEKTPVSPSAEDDQSQDDQENPDGQSVTDLQTIVVADTPTTHHLNLYVAKEKGIFEAHGLDVVIEEIHDPAAARDAVSTGAADVYWACPTAVMGAIDGGAPISMIAQVKKPCTSVLAVPADSPIQTAEDLNGKTIAGLSPSCCAVVFIQKLADESGVSFDLVNMAGGPAIAALQADQVDGIIVEEPHASIAELEGFRILFRSEMEDSACRTINGNTNFIRENPETISNMLLAIQEANEIILADPIADDIVEIAIDYTRAPEEAIRLGNPRLGFSLQLETDILIELGDYLVEQGLINSNPIPQGYADASKDLTW